MLNLSFFSRYFKYSHFVFEVDQHLAFMESVESGNTVTIRRGMKFPTPSMSDFQEIVGTFVSSAI